MATIQIQIDDDAKTAADLLLNDYGLNTESAIKIFISTVINRKGIPFDLEKLSQMEEENLETIKQKRLAFMNCMKGKVWIADDFDEPLEDMQEYME